MFPTITLTFSLLIFIAHVHGNCYEDCSKNGFCLDEKTCECEDGFFDSPDIEGSDCTKSIMDLRGGFFIFLRIVYSILYGAGFILSVLALIFVRRVCDKHPPIVNITKFILCCNSFIALVSTIHWMVDPYGINKVWPFLVAHIVEEIVDPLMLVMFTCLLFHWIELYNQTMKALKQQEMINKINSAYKYEVGIEDILIKVRFINKFRIPLIIIVAIALGIFFLRQGFRDSLKGGDEIFIAYTAYFTTIWAVLSVGFLLLRPNFLRVMPDQLSRKFNKLAKGITILVVSSFLFWIGVIVVAVAFEDYRGPNTFFGVHIFYETPYVIWIFIHTSIYIRPHRRFPFLFPQTTPSTSNGQISCEPDSDHNSHSKVELPVENPSSDINP